MCWTEFERLACDEHAPGRARAWLRDLLESRIVAAPDPEAVLYGVTLVASELVTNAVQAQCGELSIALTVHHDRVRIDVEDDMSTLPRLVTAEPGATTGRGLAITAAVARDWGYETRAVGKQVWAELPLTSSILEDGQCTIPPSAAWFTRAAD